MISTPLYVHMGVRTYTSLVYSVHTLCTVHSILGTTQSTLSTMNTRRSPNDFDDAVHRLCKVEGGGGGGKWGRKGDGDAKGDPKGKGGGPKAKPKPKTKPKAKPKAKPKS